MENQEYQNLLEECKVLKNNGLSQEAMTLLLKQKDVFILTAIRINRQLFNMSLQQAKEYVATSYAYKDIHEANKDFHEQLIEGFRTDRTG